MKKLTLVVLLLCSFNTEAVEVISTPDCQKAVSEFLTLPRKHTFNVLAKEDENRCWDVIKSSNSNLKRLTHFVKIGNKWAAQYLAKNLSTLDGGNLEDSLVSLGQFSENNMELFLIFASQEKISKHQFVDALTMLPLSLSDDQSAQLKALKKRKKLVTRVQRKDLLESKTEALKAINALIIEVEKNKKM